jgi:predicted dehydrogenase
MAEIAIGLIGAGAIGRAHITGALAQSAAAQGVKICGIADPGPAARVLADAFGIAYFADDDAMRTATRPDGVVIATPNSLHVPIALRYIAHGIPVLLEKPICETAEDGYRLSGAAAKANVQLLVGHHRRHNPVVRRARELALSGALETLVSVGVLAAFRKADAYFDVAWRRAPGGGPVLINLIHEIDLLRFVCGEIDSIQAVTSNAGKAGLHLTRERRGGREVLNMRTAYLKYARFIILAAIAVLIHWATFELRYMWYPQPPEVAFLNIAIADRMSTGTKASPRRTVGDMRAQIQQCFQNIGDALKEAGAAYHDVVKWTMFTTDIVITVIQL